MVFHNLPDRTGNALILGHTVTEVPSTLALFGNEHGARKMTYQEKGPIAMTDDLSFNPIIHMLEKKKELMLASCPPNSVCTHTMHALIHKHITV